MSIQDLALRLVDTIAAATGRLDQPFQLEKLITQAQKQTGLTEFGDVDFAEPLRHLLASCAQEALLSVIGRSATRWDVVRFLTNLLRIQAAEQTALAITEEPIERPVFITGLPRSGTTFLHRLMMEDAASRAPLVWETIYPYPDHVLRPGARDPRPAKVARQLRTFEMLAPEFRALHPLNAESPQECSEITAHVFRSLRFDTNYHIPSYRSWLDADVGRHLPAYRFHKRFLQHLQYQSRRAPSRWVLKCPEHLFALRAIRAVYPDARLIFVHRDPVKVLLSQAKLTEVLRRPFTRLLDRETIGGDESNRWLDGTRRMIEIGDDAGLPEKVCHVHHMDLISDPLSTVEMVYRHFGMDLTRQAGEAMCDYVRARPNGGYGVHRYDVTQHGLDVERERERFKPYMLAFGVAPEAAGDHRNAASPTRQDQAVGSMQT